MELTKGDKSMEIGMKFERVHPTKAPAPEDVLLCKDNPCHGVFWDGNDLRIIDYGKDEHFVYLSPKLIKIIRHFTKEICELRSKSSKLRGGANEIKAE